MKNCHSFFANKECEFYPCHENITGDLEYIQNDNSIILEYKVYSQKFSEEILLNAEYVTHWIDVDMAHQTTEDLFEEITNRHRRARIQCVPYGITLQTQIYLAVILNRHPQF